MTANLVWRPPHEETAATSVMAGRELGARPEAATTRRGGTKQVLAGRRFSGRPRLGMEWHRL